MANVKTAMEYAAKIDREALEDRLGKWVGLTDEEISTVDWKTNETLHDFARAIEAKLKEKNGG